MKEMSKVRLNVALRELNISLDRAVEFLSHKKIEIEARPTTKISKDIYQLLLDEFEIDKSKKDASHEISEEKKKEKESIRVLQEKKELERQEKQQKFQEIIKAKANINKPVTLGKIDLDHPKSKNQDFQITDKDAEANKNFEKVEKDDAEENEKKDSSIALNESSKKNIVEKDFDGSVKTNYKTLSGPKVTGQTIDLDEFKKKEKTVEDARKRKRKRISKDSTNKSLNEKKSNNITTKNKSSNVKSRQEKPLNEEPSDEEVQKQIRETLEKLQGKSNKSKGAKYRRDKRDQHRQKSEDELAEIEASSKILKVTEFITVGEIATLMEISTTEIISACMTLGIMVTMNQRLDAETLSIVADEFGYQVEFVKTELEESIEEQKDEDKDLETRAPIVTVMGHVDHGKTSLLDYIREENVIAGESGGITQHIGAYSVTIKNKEKITFLDTPGHEAFTAMRARGAQVTDIAIIVIAADDDIMPQTKEAISHAQAAGVPIVFAINKIDKQNANPDKIKESLAGMNLMVEDWGGKVQSQDISALNGIGIKELLEKVLLEAELLELKANPSRKAKGTVVEAFLDKGRGYVSTILVQNGTLKMGDYILAGKQSGKVKAIFNERGANLNSASPATPVSILGLDGAPQAGDSFLVLENLRFP